MVGTMLATGKHILELHHPRIGKQQGGVVDRDQWAAGDDFVAVVMEIIKEKSAKFSATGHGRASTIIEVEIRARSTRV